MTLPLFWLLIGSLGMLILALWMGKGEFVSPAVLLCASFSLCSVSALYMEQAWLFSRIQVQTLRLVLVSQLLFLAVDGSFRLFLRLRTAPRRPLPSPRPLEISSSVLYLSLFLGFICCLWSLVYILRFSGSSWNATMAAYKLTVNTDPASLGLGKKLLNQAGKILIGLNYVLLFVYCHNQSCGSRKHQGLYLLSFLLFLLFRMLLTGGRQSLLFFLTGFLTLSFLCRTHRRPRKLLSRERRKFLRRLLVLLLLSIPLFYFFGRFVGRKESGILHAFAAYLTTGLYGLDTLVREQYASAYFGQISFPGLYPLFQLLGWMPKSLESQPYLPFFRHGNTVSLLGRWFWDFGEWGVYVMVLLTALLFCWLYHVIIRSSPGSHRRNRGLIFYGYLVHILFFAGYDDFVMNLPTLNFLLIACILPLFYYFIVRRRIRLVIQKAL